LRSEKRVAIIGFGAVGRALARLIAEKHHGNERLKIVALADSRGMVLKHSGFSSYELLKLCELPRSGLKEWPGALDLDLELLYNEVWPDVHVELTPANYETGEPGMSNIVYAISSGAHVVTANKAPLALKFSELMDLARKRGVSVRFRATVMGGTPLIDMLLSVRSYDVESVQGILNATTNFILTEMHTKLMPMEEALKKAQAIGVAEMDPRLDLEGWDSAAKITILSNVIGKPIRLQEVAREPLAIKLSDVVECLREGFVVRYIAALERDGKAYVKPVKLGKEDPLAGISGIINAVRITTTIGEIFFAGKGGGGLETAYNVLDDVTAVIR